MTTTGDPIDRLREEAIRRQARRVREGERRLKRMADPPPMDERLVAEVRRRTLAGQGVRAICRAMRVSTDTVARARKLGRCEKPPGWPRGTRRRAYVRLVCAQCGRAFELRPGEARRPGRLPRQYCSRACSDQAEREVFAACRQRRTCLRCGKEFQVLVSRVNTRPRRGRFCSRRCAAVWAWHMGSRRGERRVS